MIAELKTVQRKTALHMRLSADDGNVDDGYSGANFTNRPQFQRMLHMVENGEIGTIIYRPNRASVSTEH